MLQTKDIKSISELTLTFVDNHNKADFFLDFVGILKLGKLHSIFSTVKQKGISAFMLIHIMLVFSFIDQSNVYSFTSSNWNKYVGYGKDAYYRLKNNPRIHWRGFLSGVVRQALATLNDGIEISPNDEGRNIKAFIFDDTTLEKTGYKIEGISKVWNHVIRRHVLGFQLLVMGFYDGVMFIPVDFSFHREKGKNKKRPFNLVPKKLKKQFNKKRDKKTKGAGRKKELDISKIASSIKMIHRAVRNHIEAEYILTDSWFTCWEMVKTALDYKLNFIGMFSKVKTKFMYRNSLMTYNAIRKLNRKNIKRNRRFNLYYVRTVVQWHGQYVVLYFTRKGKRGKWKTLLSTDIKSNFNQTIEVYQIRWSIEVFFKESKQMLGLGKSQSIDFDAQVADTTLVMIRYLFLALRNRMDNYETLGKLFEHTKSETLEIKLHDRLIELLIAIIQIIDTLFEQADSEQIMSKIIHDPSAFERIRLLLSPKKNTWQPAA